MVSEAGGKGRRRTKKEDGGGNAPRNVEDGVDLKESEIQISVLKPTAWTKRYQ